MSAEPGTPVRLNSQDDNSTPVRTNFGRQQKRLLKRNIKEVLLQFKLNELITDVILDLFDLESSEVREKLVELRLPCTKDSVATLLTSRSQAFNVQDLEDIYHSIMLYRTALGSKRKTWMSVSLLEPTEEHSFPTDERSIRTNILQGLRIKGLNAVVKVITHDGLIWVMIVEKKLTRKKGIKLLTPIFICYEIGLPYIFTASKINDITMESILRAMKYKKHKYKQLEGNDVKSLLALLKNKATNGNTHVVPFTDQGHNLKIGHRYAEVSSKQYRESYVKNVFDIKEPVHLQTFHVNAEAEWRCDIVPEMRGEPFPVTMTLKSKDVVGMVKHMASKGMVTMPLPGYLLEIVRSAKNKVHMKTQNT